MRTLFVAGVAGTAFIAPALAAALAPKEIQATFFTGQPFTASTPKLDFGQKSRGSSAARNAEHRIGLDDLMSALEHELEATEISEGAPPPLDV